MKFQISHTRGGSMGSHAILLQDGIEIARIYEASDELLDVIEFALNNLTEDQIGTITTTLF